MNPSLLWAEPQGLTFARGPWVSSDWPLPSVYPTLSQIESNSKLAHDSPFICMGCLVMLSSSALRGMGHGPSQ